MGIWVNFQNHGLTPTAFRARESALDYLAHDESASQIATLYPLTIAMTPFSFTWYSLNCRRCDQQTRRQNCNGNVHLAFWWNFRLLDINDTQQLAKPGACVIFKYEPALLVYIHERLYGHTRVSMRVTRRRPCSGQNMCLSSKVAT